ncbi:MAG TPA: hypothetical protein VFL14_05635 [Xanthomonadales bacterium]|nr:hypothetical protein [Xanthomonadales bacterium]
MAAPRLKKSTRTRAAKSTQIVPKTVAELPAQVNDKLATAKAYAAEHPWIAAAAGVGVLAVAWSARRMLLPLAATAAVERLLPGSTSAMTLSGLAKSVKQLKPSFLP